MPCCFNVQWKVLIQVRVIFFWNFNKYAILCTKPWYNKVTAIHLSAYKNIFTRLCHVKQTRITNLSYQVKIKRSECVPLYHILAKTINLRKSTTYMGQDTYQGPNGQRYVSRSWSQAFLTSKIAHTFQFLLSQFSGLF